MGVRRLCKGVDEHIHVTREAERILYSTTCTECFHRLLTDPEIYELLEAKK